jgi:hypothetical protein
VVTIIIRLELCEQCRSFVMTPQTYHRPVGRFQLKLYQHEHVVLSISVPCKESSDLKALKCDSHI